MLCNVFNVCIFFFPNHYQLCSTYYFLRLHSVTEKKVEKIRVYHVEGDGLQKISTIFFSPLHVRFSPQKCIKGEKKWHLRPHLHHYFEFLPFRGVNVVGGEKKYHHSIF